MSNNILVATVTIRGVRPLWYHWFGPDAIPLEKQEKSGVAGNNPEEWRRTALINKEGQLYVEPSYLFASIRAAGKYTKRNRATLQAPISATLQVIDNRIMVDRWFPGFPSDVNFDILSCKAPDSDPDLPVYLDVRGVVNPTTKGRNVRYRIAASSGWTASFQIQWDKTIVSRSEMEAVLIDAGRLVGIGNGRSIGMGRFLISGFNVEEN